MPLDENAAFAARLEWAPCQPYRTMNISVDDDIEVPTAEGDVLQSHRLPRVGEHRSVGFAQAPVLDAQTRESVDNALHESGGSRQDIACIVRRGFAAHIERRLEE